MANFCMKKIRYYTPRIVVQFNHWGRTVMMAGSELMFICGMISLFYGWIGFFIGIYAIVLGALIFPFVWPLETFKKRGYIVIFQKFKIVGPVLILISIPLYFVLPLLLSAPVVSFSGLLYTLAALRKEESLSKDKIMNRGRV
eukprot:TRINITY_DN14511_c0_g1_i1.p1 TRINITY_DN14511_c0_g1~~TRINITY_DN14511_c0_g1_i1.p1  ORF type:complete len:142 (-),score=26.31 TRINITY_DN14511_c0_g1_i1:77-502(-)